MGNLTLTKLDINSIEESVLERVPNFMIREWALGCRRHVIAGCEIKSNPNKSARVSTKYRFPELSVSDRSALTKLV